jgi:hypothetical protein
MLVAKLRGARDRKRRAGVKVEGRKSIAEEKPETFGSAARTEARKPISEVTALPKNDDQRSSNGRHS